jgi:hypothetical protein
MSMRAEGRNGHEIKSIDRLIERLDKTSELLRYDDAMALETNISALDAKIKAAAKLFYCVCGSATLNGVTQVPHDLWAAVHKGMAIAQVGPGEATDATDLSIAHAAVLDHFAVNARAIERLAPEAILELRTDGATQRAVRTLRRIVEDVATEWATAGRVQSGNLEAMAEYKREISDRVERMCLKQARKANYEEYGGMGLEEALSQGASLLDYSMPGIGLARKGALKLGRPISRWGAEFAHADVTLTPVATYVTRLQGRISVSPRS